MTARILLMFVLIASISACGRGGPNGLSLFGGSRAADTEIANPEQDPRPLIDQILDLKLERVPGGAIVRARGLPPTQGYFDADLLVLNGGVPVNGVLTFQFRAAAPLSPARAGTPLSREIIVGTFLTDQSLAGIRSIRVSGARNALAVRR